MRLGGDTSEHVLGSRLWAMNEATFSHRMVGEAISQSTPDMGWSDWFSYDERGDPKETILGESQSSECGGLLWHPLVELGSSDVCIPALNAALVAYRPRFECNISVGFA
jgi:hypothetical protein